LEAFGKIGFKSSGLHDPEQNLGFSLFEFQAFFSLIQATRQVAHAEGYEEEDGEHEGIFWLGDVKGETGWDEEEVPNQRAQGGKSEDRTAAPAQRRDDNGHEEEERWEHIPCESASRRGDPS
jgi:hypothetical protein